MKIWSLLVIVILLFANITHAQNRMNSEQRAKQQTAQMTKDLNLTEEQQGKVAELNKNFGEKMRNLHEENQGDRDKMRESMTKLRDERDNELKKILTADQFNKHKELEEKRMKGHQDRGRSGAPNR
nr:hypothetical protein [uncultured Carboxylicivirga sp.]